jgi:hypothetical protein
MEQSARYCPNTPITKFGKKGFTGFYRYPHGEVPTASFRGKDGRVILDILGHGRQTVIPPTVHPETGRPYEWQEEGIPLLGVSPEDLPELEADIVDRIRAALKPWLLERASWDEKEHALKVRPDGEFTPAEFKRYEAYAQACLRARASDLAHMGKASGRNDALYRDACVLGKYAVHGIVAEGEIKSALIGACERNGLKSEDGDRSIRATIQSGLRRAQNDPLPMLEDRPSSNVVAHPRAGVSVSASTQAWPEPGPLPDGLEPVAAFDFNLIPDKLRPWAEDIANTMQAPPDFVGVAIVTGLGAVIGRKLGIRPQENTLWTETANQ